MVLLKWTEGLRNGWAYPGLLYFLTEGATEKAEGRPEGRGGNLITASL